MDRAAYRAMQAGKAVAVPGFVNAAGVFGTRLGPRGLVARIAGYLNRVP